MELVLIPILVVCLSFWALVPRKKKGYLATYVAKLGNEFLLPETAKKFRKGIKHLTKWSDVYKIFLGLSAQEREKVVSCGTLLGSTKVVVKTHSSEEDGWEDVYEARQSSTWIYSGKFFWGMSEVYKGGRWGPPYYMKKIKK